MVQGRRVLVGSEKFVRSRGIEVWPHAEEKLETVQAQGYIGICAAVDGAFAGKHVPHVPILFFSLFVYIGFNYLSVSGDMIDEVCVCVCVCVCV